MSGVKLLERHLSITKTNSLFDEISQKYLRNISVYDGKESEIHLIGEDEIENNISLEQDKNTVVQQNTVGLLCSTCKINFEDFEKQRDHFKLDWHRFNIKYKLLAKSPLTESEFECQISGELSSISGSDSDSQDELSDIDEIFDDHSKDDEVGTKSIFCVHPFKLYLRTSDDILFSLYKNVVIKNKHDNLLDLKNVDVGNIWVYMMLSGGHFAAAVYDKNELLVHKTFHRYTIRAKRGTSQRVQDNKQGGQTAKSAGSTIRRHNEAALIQDIHNLLVSWSEYIVKADKIFYRCSTYNTNVLFSDKSNICKDDKRIVKISIMTRRPTLKEVKRIHHLFSTVEIYGKLDSIKETLDILHKGRSAPPLLDASTQLLPPVPNDPMEQEEAMVVTGTHLKDKTKSKKKITRENTIQQENKKIDETLCRCPPVTMDCHLELWMELKNNIMHVHNQSVKNMLVNQPNELDNGNRMFFFQNDLLNFCCKHHTDTLLHCASKSDNKEIIAFLMEQGANPTVKNFERLLPYHVTKKKDTRNEFRKYMAKYPDAYDYKKADIPSPLTEAEEIEQLKKAAEKKKSQNKARKERNKTKKAEERTEKVAEKERKNFDALSDREKRAVMAERRFATQLTNSLKCSQCRSAINEKDAFKRYEYMYCTTHCAHAHKKIIGK